MLRTIAGFLKPASGTLRLDGGGAELPSASNAHFVGHANAVKANLTVRENVAILGRAISGPRRAALNAPTRRLIILRLVDLGEFPAALSFGRAKAARSALPGLLVAKRPLWLLDEPTVSLDAASAGLLSPAVNAHLDTGGLVVAATHLPLGFERAREFNIAAAHGEVPA